MIEVQLCSSPLLTSFATDYLTASADLAAESENYTQVDEVKNIMVDNIEKVLERGEKIELLVDKTDNLRFQVSN